MSSAPVDPRRGEWLDDNRATWDERVPLHLAGTFYDLTALRAGRGELLALEERALARMFPDGFAGRRVLHLQCYFGADTLAFAQRGADVVGIDFSAPAIAAASELAAELGLADRARFVEANLYDAATALPEPASFDLVFTSWGTIGWLPDLEGWARVIASFLRPGGRFFFADSHPTAWVFDGVDESTRLPRFAVPYDSAGEPEVIDEQGDYSDPDAILEHTRTWEWAHPLEETLGSLLDAGLRLDRLEEHYELPWRMFPALERSDDGLYRWPDRRWLPLALTLEMTRTA